MRLPFASTLVGWFTQTIALTDVNSIGVPTGPLQLLIDLYTVCIAATLAY